MKYKITPNRTGVLLKLWEPAQKTGDRTAPILFALNLQFRNPDEAENYVNQYRLANYSRV